jgi:anaerobic selenocysteine-containing dehydrogenase
VSDWKKTTCAFCAVNCGLEVQTDGNRITKVRPDKDSPRSPGYACRKGLSIGYFQDHADRLTHPLKRVGDAFEKIPWEQAITEIAVKLKEIVGTHGAKSLALMGGAGLGCHFGGGFARGVLRGLGSQYHYSALAQELTGQFFVQGEAYGSQRMAPHPDFEHADVLVIWGANPWRSHHMARARPFLKEVSKDPNKLLIVIDPCKTETADRADIHLAPRPGTDSLLMKSMIAILVEEGIYDKEYVKSRTTGLEEVLRHLEGFDVAEALRVCRLDEAEVRRITRLLAERKSCIRSDLGLLMSRNSTVNSYLEMILLNLLGRIGERGGNVFSGHILQMGSHSPIDDPSYWRTVETDFPAIVGMHPPNVMPEEIMSENPDRLRAVLVSNSNPLRSYADTGAYEKAFQKLDLLVTVDIAMSETARVSHYVLPARSPYEKWDGTFFAGLSGQYPECHFHLRHPLCEPVGEPKEEAEIWTDLADALGLIPAYSPELEELAGKDRMQFAAALMGYVGKNPDKAPVLPFVLARTLGKALDSAALPLLWVLLSQYCQTAGPKLERAGLTPSLTLGDELFQKFVDTPCDILVGVDDVENNLAENLSTSDGKVHLHIPVLDDGLARINPRDELEALERADYPMLLMAGERSDYNATTRMRNRDWMTGKLADKPACTMKIHPEDASKLGLETGGMARLETQASSLEVEVEVSERPYPGTVSVPHGFGLEHCGRVEGVNVNYLTPAGNRDPLAATPLHKSIPCRVSAA